MYALFSGDFTLYDHVLDHSAAFNVIPSRYTGSNLSPLDVYFAMGRGRQADGVDVPASEMKKWYVVKSLSSFDFSKLAIFNLSIVCSANANDCASFRVPD